jgi:hypothetical protein
MKSFLSLLKKILLWSYHRGSWQYDVLCILILAFIFLTPSDWFNPKPEKASKPVEQFAPPPPPAAPARQPPKRDENPPPKPSDHPAQP